MKLRQARKILKPAVKGAQSPLICNFKFGDVWKRDTITDAWSRWQKWAVKRWQ